MGAWADTVVLGTPDAPLTTLSDANGIVTITDASGSTGIQQGSSSYKITYDGTAYVPMKLSGSRNFTLTYKEGVTINSVTLLAMSNGDAAGTVGGGDGEATSLGTFPARNKDGNCLTVDITSNTGLRGSRQFLALIVVDYTPAPVTDPVIDAVDAITIRTTESGKDTIQTLNVGGANLSGSTLTATLNPAVSGLSVALASNTIADGAITTTATLTYNATENAKGTTTLTLSDGTTSKDVTVNYAAKVVYAELQPISDAATWDFGTDVTYTGKTDFMSYDQNKDIVYADFDELTFAENFNAAALSFQGQFPLRASNKKFAQNGTLHFKTTVPGTIKVKFTDTGSGASETAVKRYLVVNGEQTEYWTSRENNGTEPYAAQLNVETDEIAVAAGDVTISGTSAICISYIIFTPAPQPVGKTVTFDFTANEWQHGLAASALDKTEGLFTDMLTTDSVAVFFGKGEGSDPYYFANSGTPQVRVVNKNYVKVYAPEGKAIKTITFEADGTFFNLTADGLTEKTWTGNATMVKLNATGTNRLTKMEVVVADADDATVTPEAESTSAYIDLTDADDPFYAATTTPLTEDMVATYKSGLLTVTYQATKDENASSKNSLTYSSSMWCYMRAYTDQLVFEVPADKAITKIVFADGLKRNLLWNAGNTINGEKYTAATLKDDGWQGNSRNVIVKFAGQTAMQDITVYIADKTAETTVYAPVTAVDIAVAATITDETSYFTTFSSKYALDFTDVEGITAYVGVKQNTGTAVNLVLTEVTKVPANTGLLIKADEAKTYTIPVAEGDVEAIEANDLIAATETVSSADTTNVYAINRYETTFMGAFLLFTDFGSVATDIPAGTAYLSLTGDEHDAAYGSVCVKFPAGPASEIADIASLKAQTVETATLTLNNAKLTYVTATHIVMEDATGGVSLYIGNVDDELKETLAMVVGYQCTGSIGLTYDPMYGYCVSDTENMTVNMDGNPAQPMAITTDDIESYLDYLSNYDWRYVKFSGAQYKVDGYSATLTIAELGDQPYEIQDLIGTGVTMPEADGEVDVEGFLYILDLSAYGMDIKTYFQPTKITVKTPTAISSVKANVTDGQIFNLNGQRVAKPVKGLNIIRGKKVVVK